MPASTAPIPKPAFAPVERLEDDEPFDETEEGSKLEDGSGIDEVGIDVAALLDQRARSLRCHAIWIVDAYNAYGRNETMPRRSDHSTVVSGSSQVQSLPSRSSGSFTTE